MLPVMTHDSLEIRNLRFDLGNVPRYWHGNQRAITLFFDNLSLFFPPGEGFFIASVKGHAKHVPATDKKLLKDVKLFCGQEAVHSREHVAYNELIEARGLPGAAIERGVERLLRVVKRLTHRRGQLAATCALERFTALMAHILLSDPRLLENADPAMAGLWRWHAAEENEHKAVAFDVFRAAKGTYVERVIAMIGATLIFWVLVFMHQVRLMWADGCLFSFGEWRSLHRFLFVEPGGLNGMMGPYLEYCRPSFHPWDHDNQALLDAWKTELDASPVYVRATRARKAPKSAALQVSEASC